MKTKTLLSIVVLLTSCLLNACTSASGHGSHTGASSAWERSRR